MDKLPYHVVHYAANDPEVVTGGVETFARNLRLVFEEVTYMTPATRDVARVQRESLPVICDNQFVPDWPEEMPVIGFQHGVGAVKFAATRSFNHWRLRRKQRRAARRPNTLWVACAAWVGETSGQLYGNAAAHVIYYPVDTERFDGRLENEGSRLILHDARLEHKGRDLMPALEAAFPDWRFEPLNCKPADVPDRMRTARAFLHLSRYEGNSLVCNEAMAMNLPCCFTRVGLMRDRNRPSDVYVIDRDVAYRDPVRLRAEVGRFLGTLETRTYNPRAWVLANATMKHSYEGWKAVMADFQRRFG